MKKEKCNKIGIGMTLATSIIYSVLKESIRVASVSVASTDSKFRSRPDQTSWDVAKAL